MMALTMMLIALMVCLTLGIGMKVREKAETQTLADTAAYSGAVLTARTFNSIALLNRVEVAQMVSLIATQSLVSYGSYYRAMVWGAREQFQKAHDVPGVCPNADACLWCTRWEQLIAAADGEINRLNNPANAQHWDAMDADAHRRIGRVLGQGGGTHAAQEALYDDLMQSQLVGLGLPPLANAIVQRVDQASGERQGELTAPATVNVVNQRELGVSPLCLPGDPQLVCRGGPSEISIQATMGTRWYAFERSARNLSQTLEDTLMLRMGLNSLIGEGARVDQFDGNTRYVSRKDPHGAPGGMGVVAEATEGRMRLMVMATGCGPQTLGPDEVTAWVYSTSYLNANDGHYFTYPGRGGGTISISEPQGTHQLSSSCDPPIAPCGIWPGFMDMNPGHADPGQEFVDLYGQPKVTYAVQRDYARRPTEADPWNLLYNISIRPSWQEQFDNKGIRTARGLDISMQTALATGLVYYHRQRHWQEPPNFWNPYWRATLVSGAIDNDGNPTRGGTDLQRAVGNGFAQQVITQLDQQGFKGWQ